MEREQLEALLQDMSTLRDDPEYAPIYRLVEAELTAIQAHQMPPREVEIPCF